MMSEEKLKKACEEVDSWYIRRTGLTAYKIKKTLFNALEGKDVLFILSDYTEKEYTVRATRMILDEMKVSYSYTDDCICISGDCFGSINYIIKRNDYVVIE